MNEIIQSEKSNYEIFKEQVARLCLRDILVEDENSIQFGQITKEKKVGIFFKRKSTEVEETYILRKEKYISLKGFCLNYIQTYLEMLNSINENFFDILESVVDEKIEISYVSFENDILEVGYANEYSEDLILRVDASKFPRVVKDTKWIYSKIEDEVYKYITKLYSFLEFSNAIKNEILLFDNINLKIDRFKICSNMIKIKLKFGDFALYEIQIMKDDLKILLFSKDLDVSRYLKINKENLLNEIFIEESKVENIIKICELAAGI